MLKFVSQKKITASILALALGSAFMLNGCTNATSTAGKVSYFTEGVITDIEHITLDEDYYNTTANTGAGAAAGALVGQLIGHDTKGTLIGAGIGAIVGGAASAIANRTSDGARLTVKTNQGSLIVDQPFSCDYYKGAKIRMINQNNGTVQVQISKNGTWRTAQSGAPRDCTVK